MPWGCGTQFGIGANDRLTGPAFTNNGRAPYSIWMRHYRNLRSSYGSGGALAVAIGNNSVLTINSTGSVSTAATSSTTSFTIDDAWPLDTWVGWGITADGTASTNDPTVFQNGKRKTVGSGLTQVGADSSYYSSYSAVSLGGRSSLGRPSGGMYEDFALWDVQLTDDEFYLLEMGESPLHIQRDHLVFYFPLNDKTQTMCAVSGMEMAQLAASTHGAFYDSNHSDPRVLQFREARSPARRKYPYLGVSAGGAVSHEFTTASFAFTAAALSPGLSTTLSAPAVNFTAQSPSPNVSTTLTAAAFNFTAQALSTGGSILYELGSAAFNFTGNAVNHFTALVHELTTASFSFVGRALNYTTGVVSSIASVIPTYFRRRSRR